MWWWGEQEAPGLEKWLNDTIAKFKEETGHTIEPTLQDTAVVISEFQTASAANDAPDMQFLWNAIYHMETAWLGYLEPYKQFALRGRDLGDQSDDPLRLPGRCLPHGLVFGIPVDALQ